MKNYWHTDAKLTLSALKLFSWVFIILGIINFFPLIIPQWNHAGNYMSFWERLFMVFSLIAGGKVFLMMTKKLALEMPNIPYRIYQLKLNKIISCFLIWSGVTMFISGVNDGNIVQWKINLLCLLSFGIGIVWYFISKYLLKKEASKRRFKNGDRVKSLVIPVGEQGTVFDANDNIMCIRWDNTWRNLKESIFHDAKFTNDKGTDFFEKINP